MPPFPAAIHNIFKKFECNTDMVLIPLLVPGTLQLDPRIMCFIH
jgi:hypothetical protein